MSSGNTAAPRRRGTVPAGVLGIAAALSLSGATLLATGAATGVSGAHPGARPPVIVTAEGIAAAQPAISDEDDCSMAHLLFRCVRG